LLTAVPAALVEKAGILAKLTGGCAGCLINRAEGVRNPVAAAEGCVRLRSSRALFCVT
jgi:hypothetical protein